MQEVEICFFFQRDRLHIFIKLIDTRPQACSLFLELGISLEMGVYVSRIYPGSVAAKEGNLAVGDRVLNVSGSFSA